VRQQLGGACAASLSALACADRQLWVLDADLADSDGAAVFAHDHPERFLNVGIAEQAMVSMAAGMAAGGLRPFAFSFAAFLCYRAYDQIRTCLSQTGLSVVLVGSHAGGCGDRNGKSHLALTDLALMSVLPGFEGWAPGDARDAHLGVRHAARAPGPSYIRLPRDPQGALPQGRGVNRWLGAPSEVALLSTGLATWWSLEVATLLAHSGVEVGVLHAPHLWSASGPGWATLLDGVKALMVIDDHAEVGGLGALAARAGFPGPIEVAAWPAGWSGQSGKEAELRAAHGLDAPTLAARFLRFRERVAGRLGGQDAGRIHS
jgi:transketolase